MLDEYTHCKIVSRTNTITNHYIQKCNSFAKVIYSVDMMYSADMLTIHLKLVVQFMSFSLSIQCCTSTWHILAHTLFNCPCRRDPHVFAIHPLLPSCLAAHHAGIHTVGSHLQALCFVWSLFCFPWISQQGAELTDLSD